MATARRKTPWGSVSGTGAAAIDIVMLEFPLGREVKIDEIEREIQRRGLKKRGAIREHLRTLRKRGHVAKIDNGWTRITA